jgi:hypothetical protein
MVSSGAIAKRHRLAMSTSRIFQNGMGFSWVNDVVLDQRQQDRFADRKGC